MTRVIADIAASLRPDIVHCVTRLARTSLAAVRTRICSPAVGALTLNSAAMT